MVLYARVKDLPILDFMLWLPPAENEPNELAVKEYPGTLNDITGPNAPRISSFLTYHRNNQEVNKIILKSFRILRYESPRHSVSQHLRVVLARAKPASPVTSLM